MCSVSSDLKQLDPIYPPSSQGYGFSSSHVRIWELDYKKAEGWRINAFELWCWTRLLRVPWTARRSNQSILKEISPEYSLEELMLKLRLRYFGHLIRRADSFEKTDAGKDWRQEEKGTTEDEMVGWTWVWVNSGSWWWTRRPGVLRFMWSQGVGHDSATELNPLLHLSLFGFLFCPFLSLLSLFLLIYPFISFLKKVGKTTRPFRYDLNQIPYDYTVEVTNRFKQFDLIECPKNYGQRFVVLYRRQWPRTSPRKRNANRQMVV